MDQKPYVGVWLDHRQALLFWAKESAELEEEVIESEYQEEGEPTDSFGVPNSPGGGVAHASLEHRRHEQLKRYYKKLGRALRAARRIYLFGPGQAKKELASVLEKDKSLRAEIFDVESADKKMTRPQMAARVREKFGLPKQGMTRAREAI